MARRVINVLSKLWKTIASGVGEAGIASVLVVLCFGAMMALLGVVFPSGTSLRDLAGQATGRGADASTASPEQRGRDLYVDGRHGDEPIGRIEGTHRTVKARAAEAISWDAARRGQVLRDRDAVQTMEHASATHRPGRKAATGARSEHLGRAEEAGPPPALDREAIVPPHGGRRTARPPGRRLAGGRPARGRDAERIRALPDGGRPGREGGRVQDPDRSGQLLHRDRGEGAGGGGDRGRGGGRQGGAVHAPDTGGGAGRSGATPPGAGSSVPGAGKRRFLPGRLPAGGVPLDASPFGRLVPIHPLGGPGSTGRPPGSEGASSRPSCTAGCRRAATTGRSSGSGTEWSSRRPPRRRCKARQDKAAPSLEVQFPSGAVYAEELVLRGRTEPSSRLVIGGENVSIDPQGIFEHTIRLKPGLNVVVIESYDRFGNVTYRSQMISRKF